MPTEPSKISTVAPAENGMDGVLKATPAEATPPETPAVVPLLVGLEGTQEALALVAEPESLRLRGTAENECSLSVDLRYEYFGFKENLNLVGGFTEGSELPTVQQSSWSIPFSESGASKSAVRNFTSLKAGSVRFNASLSGRVGTETRRSSLDDVLISMSTQATTDLTNKRSSGGQPVSTGQGRQSPWLTGTDQCTTCTGPSASVGTGDAFSCVLMNDRSLRCWGGNYNERLGVPITGVSTSIPVIPRGPGSETRFSNVVQISMAGPFACAVQDQGDAFCWGWDGPSNSATSGRLGQGGNSAGRPTSVKTDEAGNPALKDVLSIDAADDWSCAAKKNGEVWCWGASGMPETSVGLQGKGTANVQKFATPVQLSGGGAKLSGMQQVVLGERHACALGTNGKVKCWGRNHKGQLGNGTVVDSAFPIDVKASGNDNDDLQNVVRLFAAGNYTCAILEDTTARCWGENRFKVLGHRSSVEFEKFPVAMLDPILNVPWKGVTALGITSSSNCVLEGNGSVMCFGRKGYLGNNMGVPSGSVYEGTDAPSSVLVTPVGSAVPERLSGVVALSRGDSHTCAVLRDGRVACWGDGANGVLGNGKNDSQAMAVFVVSAENPATDLKTAGVRDCQVVSARMD